MDNEKLTRDQLMARSLLQDVDRYFKIHLDDKATLEVIDSKINAYLMGLENGLKWGFSEEGRIHAKLHIRERIDKLKSDIQYKRFEMKRTLEIVGSLVK